MSVETRAVLEAGCVAVFMAAMSAPAVLSVLRRQQILDIPTDRSSHVEATPRGGGICCYLAAMTALIVASPLGAGSRVLLAGLATGFAALGFVDDVRHLPVRTRLLLQTAMGIAAAGWLFHNSADPVTTIGVLGLVAAVWIVGYVNVFNFMDGVNGLAASGAAVSGVIFAVVGCTRHDVTLAVGGTIAVAAAVGFLPWNFPHARFFLGDVGSYFFGAWVAVLVVVALLHHVPFEAALAPQAVFVADAGSTLAGRIWRGEDWTAAHRGHVYQRLHQLGWSHAKVTSLLTVLMAVVAALGVASLGSSTLLRGFADAVALLLLLGYLAAPSLLRPRHLVTL